MPDQLRQQKLARLKAYGCHGEPFEDNINSGEVRHGLTAAIGKCVSGDVLVIERLSDAARSMFEVNSLAKTLEAKGVALHILYFFGQHPLDTSNQSGAQWFDYVKEFQNAVESGMIERRLKGIYAAKREGVFKGHKPLAPEKVERIIKRFEAGTIPREIAKLEGISRVSVYRILKRDRAGKETTSTTINTTK